MTTAAATIDMTTVAATVINNITSINNITYYYY